VCSLRDILVGREPDQQAHDTLSCVLANRYFDAILVHSDPRFARLEDSFRPAIPLQVPVFHTGFVVPDDGEQGTAPDRERRIVVSAGGGRFGGPLLRAALAARPLLPADLRLELVAGPFLPEPDWQSLCASAADLGGVEAKRFVPDLAASLRTAAGSVSQCGYNTTLDLLRARVPALVVPFAAEGEDEQTRRAQRLERLGSVRVLDPAKLDAESLAEGIRGLLAFNPERPTLDLEGAGASTRLLARLAARPAARREEAVAL
jgi:predicted glycosyltransferase